LGWFCIFPLKPIDMESFFVGINLINLINIIDINLILESVRFLASSKTEQLAI